MSSMTSSVVSLDSSNLENFRLVVNNEILNSNMKYKNWRRTKISVKNTQSLSFDGKLEQREEKQRPFRLRMLIISMNLSGPLIGRAKEQTTRFTGLIRYGDEMDGGGIQSFEWMNGWMDGMYAWMNRWMNEWMNEWMNGWMDGWMDGWTYVWMNRRLTARMDEQMDGESRDGKKRLK